jgi:SAM-dependent MidA family methyltransferase
LIRERGPLTVAAFMDLALYDPGCGYYARAAQRSGRAGDFFTSVDVGPMFGELLEIQIAEMAAILSTITAENAKHAEKTNLSAISASSAVDASPAVDVFDLVEAGAGNGRLSADILRTARRRDPLLYERMRLYLVEASSSARAAQRATMGDEADRIAASSDSLPAAFEGVLIANELLDALPIHQVVMREDGLREVYVDISASGRRLVTREGPVSSPALSAYLEALDIALEPGWRAEINLRAAAWIAEVARRMRRGFVILIDYGHDARELYSPTHASGTLTTFARHTMAGPDASADTPPWLVNPGGQDITAHVDFTSVRAAAEAEGLTMLGFLDQTYFLLGLIEQGSSPATFLNSLTVKDRLALKTLLMPGGLGSTHKVMILSKGAGTPRLRGISYRTRVT